jgi:RHS repeat-associated protein
LILSPNSEDVETGLYYNRFRYYSPETGLYISQDPIKLEGNNPNFYAYVSDSNSFVDVFGLDCKAKLQPYRSDVLSKGPQVDILHNNRKVTEALLDVVDNNLIWTRFGDIVKDKKIIKQADKTIDNLLKNKSIMKGAREQTQHAIKEMSEHLTNGTKRQIDFAKRNIPKFEKMVKLIDDFL